MSEFYEYDASNENDEKFEQFLNELKDGCDIVHLIAPNSKFGFRLVRAARGARLDVDYDIMPDGFYVYVNLNGKDIVEMCSLLTGMIAKVQDEIDNA